MSSDQNRIFYPQPRKLGLLFSRWVGFILICAWIAGALNSRAADSSEASASQQFHKEVEPVLKEYCYDCHGDGMSKGDVTFDQFKTDRAMLENKDLWWNVLKYLRAGIMPPQKKPQPSADQKLLIANWIKAGVFQIDPENPDPGRVTLRRLNRTEYRNTIRDLMGVDFNTSEEFPPDDTGYGFDNIGDVLTLSPMLLEKYVAAAESIVKQAVPTEPRVPLERTIRGVDFHRETNSKDDSRARNRDREEGVSRLSYSETSELGAKFQAAHAGTFHVVLDFAVKADTSQGHRGTNACQFTFKADDKPLLAKSYGSLQNEDVHLEFDQHWTPGEHHLTFHLDPVVTDTNHLSKARISVMSVAIKGPMETNFWVEPKNYSRFFTKEHPATSGAKRAAARDLLRQFATKAFRRPVDEHTVDRLVALAQSVFKERDKTFEAGVANAMVAVLASPRFLFREEGVQPASGPGAPLIDEYALASRLSYFLWSTMPDDELFNLAATKQLRTNLDSQIKRMLGDPKSDQFVKNFTGQWLQGRDVEDIAIEPERVLTDVDLKRAKMSAYDEVYGLRTAMRRETESYFNYIVHEDRPITELVDSDYTFVNERLADFYGIDGVTGANMRKVMLPTNSPRGGIITMGGVLAVTSNPTRTSPVKRGKFILENIMGTPPPPPPPNIPSLEDSRDKFKEDRRPTGRELLELHRANPACASCHNRMDPLGLALENFNALGMWRDQDRKQPIDASGKLISGESFANVRELKHVLVANHRDDFYRCITEKLFIYALGRGVEYSDVGTIDQIVANLDAKDGRFSVLLKGIIESNPFQKRRTSANLTAITPTAKPGN
jgi:mono/diheme cytochrome c family protein